MKELSIEEKAQRYDEAIERAKSLLSGNQLGNAWIYKLLPELEESEDENVRKSIIAIINNYVDNSNTFKPKMIAWLEKQGEQKPILPKWKYKKDNTPLLRDSLILNKCGRVAKSPSGALVSDVWVMDYDELAKLPKEDFEEQNEQKPKFRVGDTIKCKYDDRQFTIKSVDLDKGTYTYTQEGCGNDIDYADEEFELVEQKPAEWSEDNLPEFESYLCLMFQKFRTKGICTNGEIIDFVMEHTQKLKDTLYHAWNEEDESMYVRTLGVLGKCYIGELPIEVEEELKWFKSLKYRVQPKQEWSMYDETILKALIDHFEYKKEFNEAEDYDIVLWLKSLKPKSHWKPSDEQMTALKEVIDVGYFTSCPNALEALYEQLKQTQPE